MTDPADFLLFEAVVRAGSFAGAARSQGVTRQAVSERIAKLEQDLGVRLMERTTRSLRLTEAGSIFHERASQITALVREATAEVSQMQGRPVGLLRVSVPEVYGRRHLVRLAHKLLGAHPELRIDAVLTNRNVNLIEEGFDAAIRVGELQESSLVARKIGEGQVHYLASPAFLRCHGRPTPETIGRFPCVALRPGETWTIAGVRTKIDPVLLVDDLEVAHDAAVAGLGIARLPSFVHEQASGTGALELLFEGEPAMTRDIWVLFPSRKHLSPKVRCFIEAIQSEVGTP